MTVRREQITHGYNGLSTDEKPSLLTNSTGEGYIPAGSRFLEIDTGRKFVSDGAGTWYELGRYRLGTRTSIAITTTSSHLYSGGSITAQGELLRQYTVELGNSTNDPTRTVSIVDANSATVWASTAIVDSTTVTRLLPTSEQVILEGTYSIVWTLSTNSGTTGITDYITLGFDRG